MTEGESARRRADELRSQAAAARARASALDLEAGAWEAGARGERLAAVELARLPGAWRVLHDRLLQPGRSNVNIDHIAVGPPGLFLIDAKHWAGRVTVHDGTLWQHNGTHRPQRRALEQVCRAAAEMEQALGAPVAPVIALTGSSAHRFASSRVGGVDVVSVRALRSWLNSQPVMINDQEIDATARRIEVAFPPAMSPEPSGDLAARKAMSAPAGHAHRSRDRTIVPQPRSSLRGTRRAALAKFVVSLAVLAMAPVVLPFVASKVSEAVNRATTPTAPGTSCQTLTAERVSAILGARVTAEIAQTGNRCSWFLGGPASAATPTATLQIESRPAASRSAVPATATAQAGRAMARVAQGQSLKNWTAPRPTAPTSFYVSLRYAYPANATRADRQKADDAALAQVTALAEEFVVSAAPTSTK